MNEISYWEIVQLIGGISVVVTGLIIAAWKLMFEKIIQSWKETSELRVSELRGWLEKENTILNSISQQYGESFQILLDQRIKAVNIYWRKILELKSTIPAIVKLSYDILHESEITYENLSCNDNFGPVINDLSIEDITNELTKHSTEIKIRRPFLSEELWSLMFTLQGFIGRSIYLIVDGYKKEKIKNWKKDHGIKQILSSNLSSEELEYAYDQSVKSYDTIIRLIENKMLQEIQLLISNEELTSDTLTAIKKINSVTSEMKWNDLPQ